MIEPVIEVGDVIAARKTTTDGVIPLQFTVTGIDGDVIDGSPLGTLNPADGWGFEVVRKADPGLPDELTEIACITSNAPAWPAHLVGRGDMWSLWGGGPRVDHTSIIAWCPWDEYVPPEEPPVEPTEETGPHSEEEEDS